MVHNKVRSALKPLLVAVVVSGVFLMGSSSGGQAAEPVSSYAPVVIKESFATIMEPHEGGEAQGHGPPDGVAE